MEIEYAQRPCGLTPGHWASDEEVNKLDFSPLYLTFDSHINIKFHLMRATRFLISHQVTPFYLPCLFWDLIYYFQQIPSTISKFVIRALVTLKKSENFLSFSGVSNAMVKSAHNFCDSIDICGYFRAVILNICTLGGLVLIFSQSILKMSVEAFICASTCENISKNICACLNFY